MSIKTNFEIPRASDEGDIVKQGQRTAMDLSKNFKAINNYINEQKAIEKSGVYGLNGVEFNQSYSIVVPSGSHSSASYTFNHGFNVVPSAFLVTDITSSATVFLSDPVITRVSWTTTQITVRIGVISIDFGATRTQAGTFKILVLR